VRYCLPLLFTFLKIKAEYPTENQIDQTPEN
jgi:hypothetical protein